MWICYVLKNVAAVYDSCLRQLGEAGVARPLVALLRIHVVASSACAAKAMCGVLANIYCNDDTCRQLDRAKLRDRCAARGAKANGKPSTSAASSPPRHDRHEHEPPRAHRLPLSECPPLVLQHKGSAGRQKANAVNACIADDLSGVALVLLVLPPPSSTPPKYLSPHRPRQPA